MRKTIIFSLIISFLLIFSAIWTPIYNTELYLTGILIFMTVVCSPIFKILMQDI